MGIFVTRGHAQALAAVQRAVVSGRPPHALLLVGEEHVGKSTLALDLAAGLLCLAEDAAARPCRECPACRKVVSGNHPDVHRVAPEGAGRQIRVGQVQALAVELALLPLEGRHRLAIFERADRLNVDAQNALLKTLEEPPATAVIVLAASDVGALLPTVVSRCARVRLGPVANDVIAGMLTEAGAADAARGTALARLSGGRPGVALALARDPEAVLGRQRVGRLLLDLLSAGRRRRLAAQSELIDDGAALAALVADEPREDAAPRSERSSARRASPAERRAATAAVIAVWRELARDLAVAAHGGVRELREVELIDELSAAGERVTPDEATGFIGRVDAAARALDAYANPELLLDSLLLSWPQATAAGGASATAAATSAR